MLKWPNDILLDGAKVAGILLEAVTQPGGASSVVIGIGVNVRHSPTDVSYPATALSKCGVAASAESLFTALSDAWVDQEFRWNEGQGFPALREHWLERASGLGSPIAVRIGDEELRGTFETIDNEGRLIIRRSDGSARAISAGDVHFGAAATARN
jgi:BirA family biotin operon repressor/biotin-[acetyl-CoA-carboxylase] ligase